MIDVALNLPLNATGKLHKPTGEQLPHPVQIGRDECPDTCDSPLVIDDCLSDRPLGVDQEVDDVAVLYLVGLALGAQHPFLPPLGQTAAPDEVVIGDDLRADEPPGEVGVDGPGGKAREISWLRHHNHN